MNYNILKRKLLAMGLATAGLMFVGCSGGSSQGGSQGSASTNEGSNSGSSMSAEEKKEQAMIKKGLGIGPVKEVKLSDEIDQEMVKRGKKLYEQNCTSCHKPTKDHIGPAPAGILDRRKPEWVMNMILNPREMVQKDPTAQKLQSEYNSVMSQQIADREKARAILEYFRTLEK